MDAKRGAMKFLGECRGVVLAPRGDDDPHVMFSLVTEDDGNWFDEEGVSSEEDGYAQGGGSSHWLDETIAMLVAARDYIRANCEPEPDGYGYRFRGMPKEPNRVSGLPTQSKEGKLEG